MEIRGRKLQGLQGALESHGAGSFPPAQQQSEKVYLPVQSSFGALWPRQVSERKVTMLFWVTLSLEGFLGVHTQVKGNHPWARCELSRYEESGRLGPVRSLSRKQNERHKKGTSSHATCLVTEGAELTQV